MEQFSFTDEQLLNLVNNTIIQKTKFSINDFTGGSIQITSTHNNTMTNYRVSLFFGYKSNKPISRSIIIEKDTFYIWAKALMLKVSSIRNDNIGMNYSELNELMNFSNKEDLSIGRVQKKVYSIVGVDRTVDLPYENDEEKFKKLNDYLLNKQINKDKESEKYQEIIDREDIEI